MLKETVNGVMCSKILNVYCDEKDSKGAQNEVCFVQVYLEWKSMAMNHVESVMYLLWAVRLNSRAEIQKELTSYGHNLFDFDLLRMRMVMVFWNNSRRRRLMIWEA